LATPGTSEVAREPARAGSTGWFLVLTGCGVALRLVALLLAGDLEPVLDEGAYLYHAACWERFGFHVDSGRWLWAPGYPLFLRVALGAFGVEGVQVAKLVQVVLSASVGFCSMRIAADLFGRRAGFAAGLLWCVHLPLIGFTHLLWPETLFLALLMPALALQLRWSQRADEPGAAGLLLPAGLLLGCAALVKEAAMLLPLVLAAAILVRLRGSWREGARAASLLVLAAVAAVLPWSLRNQEVHGQVALVGASAGYNSWVGVTGRTRNFDYPAAFLAPGRDGYASLYDAEDWRFRAFIERPEGTTLEALPARREGRSPRNAVQLSRAETARAWRHARRHPGLFLRGRIKQLSNWVTPTSFFVRHMGMGRYVGLQPGGWLQRALLVTALLVPSLVLILGVRGLVRLVRARAPGTEVVLAALALAVALALLVGMSRHRAAWEPLLIVLAAGGLLRGPVSAERGPSRVVLLGWALLGGLWFIGAPELVAAVHAVWGGAS